MEARATQTIDLRHPAPAGVRHSPVLWIDTERFTAMLAPPPAAPSGRLWLAARVGIALLLAVNALFAFIQPEEFENLLRANPIGGRLPNDLIRSAVLLAGVNDIILAMLVIAQRWRSWVWCWVGAWFAVIAATKVLNLLA